MLLCRNPARVPSAEMIGGIEGVGNDKGNNQIVWYISWWLRRIKTGEINVSDGMKKSSPCVGIWQELDRRCESGGEDGKMRNYHLFADRSVDKRNKKGS